MDTLNKFEILKKKLEVEGVFDNSRKKKLPSNPRKIITISRENCNLINDFLPLIRKNKPDVCSEILIFSDKGKSAIKQIEILLQKASELNASVIIIVSKLKDEDDYEIFCSEELSRAIAASNIPVITAVGHEIDWPLCDYAADVRAGSAHAVASLICS